ncbi:UPF0134 protein [Frankliniella fusca]|uniref:UPF0134 protein n=1 Tax=Frankliniella fusca TaxID=407009 RepID=A0AAE1H246_9NEOP|nr:UPF0134 protein [Frankliniella fusca]
MLYYFTTVAGFHHVSSAGGESTPVSSEGLPTPLSPTGTRRCLADGVISVHRASLFGIYFLLSQEARAKHPAALPKKDFSKIERALEALLTGLPQAGLLLTREAALLTGLPNALLTGEAGTLLTGEAALLTGEAALLTGEATLLTGLPNALLAGEASTLLTGEASTLLTGEAGALLTGEAGTLLTRQTALRSTERGALLTREGALSTGQVVEAGARLAAADGALEAACGAAAGVPLLTWSVHSQSLLALREQALLTGEATLLTARSRKTALLTGEAGTLLAGESTLLAGEGTLLTGETGALLTGESSLLAGESTLLTGEAGALLAGESALLAGESTLLAGESSLLAGEAGALLTVVGSSVLVARSLKRTCRSECTVQLLTRGWHAVGPAETSTQVVAVESRLADAAVDVHAVEARLAETAVEARLADRRTGEATLSTRQVVGARSTRGDVRVCRSVDARASKTLLSANVEDALRTVHTTLGSVEATLRSVEATLRPVEASLGSVEATLGSVEATLESIEATLRSVEPSWATCARHSISSAGGCPREATGVSTREGTAGSRSAGEGAGPGSAGEGATGSGSTREGSSSWSAGEGAAGSGSAREGPSSGSAGEGATGSGSAREGAAGSGNTREGTLRSPSAGAVRRSHSLLLPRSLRILTRLNGCERVAYRLEDTLLVHLYLSPRGARALCLVVQPSDDSEVRSRQSVLVAPVAVPYVGISGGPPFNHLKQQFSRARPGPARPGSEARTSPSGWVVYTEFLGSEGPLGVHSKPLFLYATI